MQKAHRLLFHIITHCFTFVKGKKKKDHLCRDGLYEEVVYSKQAVFHSPFTNNNAPTQACRENYACDIFAPCCTCFNTTYGVFALSLVRNYCTTQFRRCQDPKADIHRNSRCAFSLNRLFAIYLLYEIPNMSKAHIIYTNPINRISPIEYPQDFSKKIFARGI